jgi:hypothetical protein
VCLCFWFVVFVGVVLVGAGGRGGGGGGGGGPPPQEHADHGQPRGHQRVTWV